MSVENKTEFFNFLRTHQSQLRKYGVKRCGVFGSFARGQQTSDSDIDVLVEFEPGAKSFDNFMQLAFFLEDRLGRRVELITPESLSPYIGPRILREVEYASVRSLPTNSDTFWKAKTFKSSLSSGDVYGPFDHC